MIKKDRKTIAFVDAASVTCNGAKIREPDRIYEATMIVAVVGRENDNDPVDRCATLIPHDSREVIAFKSLENNAEIPRFRVDDARRNGQYVRARTMYEKMIKNTKRRQLKMGDWLIHAREGAQWKVVKALYKTWSDAACALYYLNHCRRWSKERCCEQAWQDINYHNIKSGK